MPLLSKLIKIGDLTKSSINEKIKTGSLRQKIRKIEKNQNENGLMIKQDLEKDLSRIQAAEKEKRDAAAKELKNEIRLSKAERRLDTKKYNIFGRLQKEFRDIPIVTAADDIIEGISGIETAQEIVALNPNEPFAWLMLAETLKYHRQTFLKVQKLKLPVDFFGSIMDVGTEYVGDFIETAVDKDKITFDKALKTAYELVQKKQEHSFLDLIVSGRCMQLWSRNVKNYELAKSFSQKAEEYYKMVLDQKISVEDEAEICFYLSEIYHSTGRFKEHRMMLYMSKNKGFVPAQRQMKKYTLLADLKIPDGVKPIDRFKYSIRKNASDEIISGAVNLVNKQGKKLANAGERVLDTVLDKVIKD